MSFKCAKICFVHKFTQKVSDTLWAMFGNGYKYIFNCASWFASIILNFNPLCDVYAISRHCTVLLKSNRIFSFLLGIIFGNFFLSVSNNVGKYLWLHFVYFLNLYPSMRKFIAKFLHTGTPII